MSYSTPPITTTPTSNRSRSQSRSFIWLLGIGLLIAGTAAAFAVNRRGNGDDQGEYLTHTVTRGEVIVSVTEEGTLESSSNEEIKCRVKGGSTVLWVIDTGTKVKQGDLLVRLDESAIEDQISAQRILYETAVANLATAESDVAVAKIGITEYLDGTFRSEMTTKKKEVVIAESNLKSAKNALEHAKKMFRKGYTSMLDLQAQKDAVKHAQLELEVKQTDLEVLEKFTKAKEVEQLQSLLKIAEAQLAARKASLDLEKARLERQEKALENCVIKSPVDGLVIYPSAAEWKEQPDIEQGANVREDQVLLMIPDLDQMQVKVGIHESKVDRLKVGMPASVNLTEGSVPGKVKSISSITKPSGWWNGNMVNYDTVIELDQRDGLKPGMSVSVEVFLAKYNDVITVPVVAVLELDKQFFCWVKTDSGIEKRKIEILDTNEKSIVVGEGLSDGDVVVMNPMDFVDEAKMSAKEGLDDKADPSSVPEVESAPQENAEKRRKTKGETGEGEGKQGGQKKFDGKSILKFADKNKDGGLSIDEVDENGKRDFEKTDTNGDGKLDAQEIDAALEKAES